MKILAINVLYPPIIGGGAEIILENICEGLAERGHEVIVLTFTNKESVKEESGCIKVHREKIPNLYLPYFHNKQRPSFLKRRLWHLIDIYNPFSQKIVKKHIENFKPEIVICHNIPGWSPSIWVAAHEKEVPLVQVLHDQYLLCPTHMFKNNTVCQERCMTCFVVRYPHKILSNKVTAVVGISNFILNKLLSNGYFRSALIKKVIYNSRKSCPTVATLRALDHNNIHIGFIGSIAPNKGIEVLFQAYSKLGSDNISLYIAGSGDEDYVNYLKTKYENHNFNWMGWVKPEQFFKKIDLLVVPSIWEESLGVIVFEAFSYGIPVIGSRIGGIPEMIKENVNGLLFEPGNYEELANKITGVLSDIKEWRRRHKEIQKSAEIFLDYNRWIDEWEGLLNEVKELKTCPKKVSL